MTRFICLGGNYCSASIQFLFKFLPLILRFGVSDAIRLFPDRAHFMGRIIFLDWSWQ